MIRLLDALFRWRGQISNLSPFCLFHQETGTQAVVRIMKIFPPVKVDALEKSNGRRHTYATGSKQVF
jgi:hypothetical protein